jgi:F-type H+-transporting ATPase subunit delta
MQNPRLAGRYAKSLIDIAQEQNVLDAVLGDMELMHKVSDSNPDLVTMLKSPIVKGDKKMAVLNAIFEGKVQKITLAFTDLLVKKGREFFLPEIASAFVSQYKELKNIKTVHLTTAVAIDEDLKQMIRNKVAASVQDGHVELETKVNEELIGGFMLEVGDKLFDASVRRDLIDIRNQFTKNLYVADI